jgi:hypothetical protein
LRHAFSLTPGFSPVMTDSEWPNRFNGFLRPSKPLKRLAHRKALATPLKRSVNEMN